MIQFFRIPQLTLLYDLQYLTICSLFYQAWYNIGSNYSKPSKTFYSLRFLYLKITFDATGMYFISLPTEERV